LGRKNHLFAGSDGGGARWATLCSLIETAKMNDLEPYAYLRDVLERMVDGHPINRLDELLPWNWKPQRLSRHDGMCSAPTLTRQQFPCRLIAAAMSTLWRAARAFMFAKWTETRTQELHRLCPLFADRTQEDGKQTGRGQAHIPASHALTGQLLRLQWLMARLQPP